MTDEKDTPQTGLRKGKSNIHARGGALPDPEETVELEAQAVPGEVLHLDGSAIRTISDLAQAAQEPRQIGGSFQYAVTVPKGGSLGVIDASRPVEHYRPARKRGTAVVRTAESFHDYLDKHGTADSDVWADLTTGKVVGVVNAHGHAGLDTEEGEAGFGDHRVELHLAHSPEWKAWTAKDRAWWNQGDFAEFLEDRATDVVDPPAGTMLEIATTLTGHKSADWQSAVRLADGQRTLVYSEKIEANAGRGSLTIPETFTVALRPYLGSDRYRVTVRFRYRMVEGRLTLAYALDRPEETLESAFEEVVAKIEENHSPVLAGTPPAACAGTTALPPAIVVH